MIGVVKKKKKQKIQKVPAPFQSSLSGPPKLHRRSGSKIRRKQKILRTMGHADELHVGLLGADEYVSDQLASLAVHSGFGGDGLSVRAPADLHLD